MTDAVNQSQYQVRFDWGLPGLAAVGHGAHIVVWVDALPSTAAAPEAATGALPGTAPDAHGTAPDPASVRGAAAIVTGSIGSAAAVAQWVLERQAGLGDRAIVAVVAAGGEHGRFAVEDLLGAGAVIDALAAVGLDYCSPGAAAASAAYQGLRTAAGHMLTACVAGKQLAAAEGREAVAAARRASESPEFALLRGFDESAG